MRKRWEYALYKGEECLAIGTREEICEEVNIKRKTFEYYRSNAYKKRLEHRKVKNAKVIIRIDDYSEEWGRYEKD